MEFIAGAIFFIFFLAIWAAIGHGIWVVASLIFNGKQSRDCPTCKRSILKSDRACRHCGWTSNPIDAKKGLTVCRQVMQGALQRKIIDEATLKRGEFILEELEAALQRERSIVPTSSVPPPSVQPTASAPAAGQTPAATAPSVKVAEVAAPPILPPVVSNEAASASPQPTSSRIPATVQVPTNVHALDQEYPEASRSPAPTLAPSRTWSQWFSVFMEESNIRWGELVGGLLIVCCSAALVISFWQFIAQRPWLKFSMFTGINVATFGLGLYAWHRWKLPTTSKGILVIGMMLLPLNFLAFALFTLGMPWDWVTVSGEILSLAILGYLAWQAALVLTPNAVAITTMTPVAFALANLLIRRTVDDESGTFVLYAWGSVLVGMAVGATALAWRPLIERAERRFAPALEFLALTAFGFVLSGGLLYLCSGDAFAAARTTSPLLALSAMPLLYYALGILQRIEKRSQLVLPMILLGAAAISIGAIAMFLAWPTPRWMIGCSLGWLGLITIAANRFRFAEFGYAVFFLLSVGVCMLWYVATGALPLDNDSSTVMMQAMGTAKTGFLLVGWSLMCAACSVALAKLQQPRLGVVALRSAATVAVVGTLLLTALGFGRVEYARSVGGVYAIYAACAFAIGVIRQRPWVEVIGAFFLAAAAVQTIAVGWVDEHWWIRVFACLLAISAGLLLVLMMKKAYGQTISEQNGVLSLAIISVGLTTLMVLLWLFLSESSQLSSSIPLQTSHFAMVTMLWVLLAWVRTDRGIWYVAQIMAIATLMLATLYASKPLAWYADARNGYLHPLMLQSWALCLVCAGAALLALGWMLRWLNRTPSAVVLGPLPAIHDANVARGSIGLGAVLVVGLLGYGAFPGVAQELIPRDALAATEPVEYQKDGAKESRLIPSLSALELEGIPHAAAGWGIGSERFTLFGLRPDLVAWFATLAAIVFVLADFWTSGHLDAQYSQTKYWFAFLLTVLLSLWFAIASQWEPHVAAASALRWLTATVFLLGCGGLCFWIYRIDRSAEPSASRAFAWIDHVFQTLSLNTLVPWCAMGSMVIASVLLQTQIMPWTWWAWAITGIMASVAGFLLLIQFNASKESPKASGGSVASITASTLLIAPLITWVILQVAVTVLAHPLTGPNPDSAFARMGLATSYAVPILMISAALVFVSAARPSPHLAFVSALLLLVTVVVGYMLALKSEGLRVVAWVGLAAALSATASLFSIVWRGYTARDHRSDALLHWSGRPAPIVREEWQRALRHVSAGFAIVGLGLIVLVVLINGNITKDLPLASLGLFAALAILLSYFLVRHDPIDLSPWIVAGGVTGMGLIAPQWSTISPSLSAASIIMGIAGGILIALSSRGLTQGNPRRYLSLILVFLFAVAIRFVAPGLGFLGPVTGAYGLAVLALLGATALAITNAWVHRDRASMVWGLVAAQGAGLVYTTLYHPGTSGNLIFWNTLFVQCAILAFLSAVGTVRGFGRRARLPLLVATAVISLLCFGWMAEALLSPNAWSLTQFPQSSLLLAIVMCVLGGLTGYWNAHSRDENGVVYLSGLCSVVWLLYPLQSTSETLLWVTTIVLGAYCLGTSFLWRAGDRIREEVAKLVWLPKPVAKPSSNAIVVLNIALAVLVAFLGLAAQFQNANLSIRFSCAQAIMAVSLAVGFLARYASRNEARDAKLDIATADQSGSTPIRILALVLGVLYPIALGWHVQSPLQTGLLDRLGVALLPLTLMGEIYGFGLIKWMGLKEDWQRAALKLMPAIVGIAIALGLACICIELQIIQENPTAVFRLYTTVCIGLAFALTLVWCVAAALLPGRDPLGLSERGREMYVYIAQGLLVLLIVHLRLTNAWLFQGLFQQVWPLFVLAVGFGGLAAAEWARTRGLRVLVNPLTNSGMLLPLLPILAPWIASSRIDYGVTLIVAAVGYGLFAYLQRSPIYAAASVFAANGAIWYVLHQADFAFSKHPQLWIIPPALCVFVAAQWFRKYLAPQQLTLARYGSVGSIYVASTSELFLQGIAKAPWLPIVLALLSVIGIFYGIAARIRSMLWLGSMFLCVALFSIIWYAAVDLEQTWIWYASGIALGIVILVIFALFEKRREDLKRIVANVQQWEE